MVFVIYSPDGQTSTTVESEDDSRHYESLNEDDFIELKFTTVESYLSAESRFADRGYYIIYKGVKYATVSPCRPIRSDWRVNEFTIQFHSPLYCVGGKPFFYSDDAVESEETTFAYTGGIDDFTALLSAAFGRGTGEAWSFDYVGEGMDKMPTLSFEGVDLMEALKAVANEFGVDFWQDYARGNMVHLGSREVYHVGDFARRELIVGEDINVPSRDLNGEYFNRVYAYGSTKNILSGYVSAVNTKSWVVERRLHLPSDTCPGGYFDVKSGVTTASQVCKIMTFEDIFPKSDLVIASVRSEERRETDSSGNGVNDKDGRAKTYLYYGVTLKDSTGAVYHINATTYDKDNNPSGDLLPGQTVKIYFTSGNLTGREFEAALRGGNETLWIQPDNSAGMVIPQANIEPRAGDRCIMVNVRMPESYVRSAERDLERTARAEAKRINETRAAYTLTSRVGSCTINDLGVGEMIAVKDEDAVEYARVVSVESRLDIETQWTAKTGETTRTGKISGLEVQVGNAVKEQRAQSQRGEDMVSIFAKRGFEQTQETARLLEEKIREGLSGAYTDRVSPIAIQTMQMVAGDEGLQFEFYKVKGGGAVSPVINWNIAAKSASVGVSGVSAFYVIHRTAKRGTDASGIHASKVSSSSSDMGSCPVWKLGTQTVTSPTDATDDKPLYLYIKGAVNTITYNQWGGSVPLTGVFELSVDVHAFEEDGYNYLLLGVYGSAEVSVNDNGEAVSGGRSFAQLYGFTEILPGRINTDKIVSSDGNTYFDLVNGVIGGNIRFVATQQWRESNIGGYVDGKVTNGVQGVRNDVNALGGRVDNTESGLAGVRGEVDALGDDVDGVKGSVTTINNNINGVRSDMAGLSARMATAEGNVNSMGYEITGVKGDVNGLTTGLNGVKGDVSSLNSGLSSVNARVDATNTTVNNNYQNIIGANGLLAQAKSELRDYANSQDAAVQNQYRADLKNDFKEKGRNLILRFITDRPTDVDKPHYLRDAYDFGDRRLYEFDLSSAVSVKTFDFAAMPSSLWFSYVAERWGAADANGVYPWDTEKWKGGPWGGEIQMGHESSDAQGTTIRDWNFCLTNPKYVKLDETHRMYIYEWSLYNPKRGTGHRYYTFTRCCLYTKRGNQGAEALAFGVNGGHKAGGYNFMLHFGDSPEMFRLPPELVESRQAAKDAETKSRLDGAWGQINGVLAGVPGASTMGAVLDNRFSGIDGSLRTFITSEDAAKLQQALNAAGLAESNAKSAAQGYANNAQNSAVNTAKGYADGVGNNAKSYADGKASTAESNAKGYADTKAASVGAETLEGARRYTDETYNMLRGTRALDSVCAAGDIPSGKTAWEVGKWVQVHNTQSGCVSLAEGNRPLPNITTALYCLEKSEWSTICQEGIPVTPGETYVISFYFKNPDHGMRVCINNKRTDWNTSGVVQLDLMAASSTWVKKSYTFTVAAGWDKLTVAFVSFFSGTSHIAGLQLMPARGFYAEIAAHDSYVTELKRGLMGAISAGKTDINGGLLLTNFLALRDLSNNNITAAIRGDVASANVPVIFAGAVNAAGADNAPFRVYPDGRIVATKATLTGGQVQNANINGDGSKGTLEIREGGLSILPKSGNMTLWLTGERITSYTVAGKERNPYIVQGRRESIDVNRYTADGNEGIWQSTIFEWTAPCAGTVKISAIGAYLGYIDGSAYLDGNVDVQIEILINGSRANIGARVNFPNDNEATVSAGARNIGVSAGQRTYIEVKTYVTPHGGNSGTFGFSDGVAGPFTVQFFYTGGESKLYSNGMMIGDDSSHYFGIIAGGDPALQACHGNLMYGMGSRGLGINERGHGWSYANPLLWAGRLRDNGNDTATILNSISPHGFTVSYGSERFSGHTRYVFKHNFGTSNYIVTGHYSWGHRFECYSQSDSEFVVTGDGSGVITVVIFGE